MQIAKISAARARIVLLVIWAFFFIFNVGAIFYLYLSRWIEQDNLKLGLLQLNSLYVTYLGVMIAFFFTASNNTALKNKRVGGSFVIALLCSLGWNGFVTIFIVRLLLQSGEIEDSLKQIGEFGPLLSWLVAPPIGYYFAKSSE